ncbi:MAG: DUF3540 domain-containing protein [Sandaracinaceae bacterium]|nr:DUF3540 domain-containing protein [Sandaracinaceae bacterium]
MGHKTPAPLTLQRLSQRVKRAYRFVEEMDVTRAGSIDYRADDVASLRARHTVMAADEQVKVDGKQIHPRVTACSANTQMMGMDLALPGRVPDADAGPRADPPIRNIALGPTAIPSQVKVMFMCTPGHNMATTIPLTNGDNAGVATGVASGW